MSSVTRILLAAAALAVVLCPGLADAGILGTYTFTGADPGGDLQTPNGNATAATQLTYTSMARIGLTQNTVNDVFRSNQYSTAASIDINEYSQLTVTAAAGYALELTSIAYTSTRADHNGLRRGPNSGAVRSSFESFGAGSGTGSTYALASNGSTVTQTWNFADYTSASAGTASFRFYGWGAAGRHQNAGMVHDNVTLNGDVVALARMQAAAAANPTGPVIVGATANADVSVQNTASGGTKQQGLNYAASGNGDLSGGGSNSNLAPGPAEVVTLSINTAVAGARGGTVTVSSNAYATNGTVGQSAFNQAVSVNVLDHSNASFATPTDTNSINVDFGTVDQGSSQSIGRTLYNLVATASFTAGLDLDTIGETDPDAVFSTDLTAFSNLLAGNNQGFLLNLDTSQLGTFSGSYTLSLSDQNLPGALGGQSLTINLLANVVAVPEPAAISGLLVFGGLLLRRRRA